MHQKNGVFMLIDDNRILGVYSNPKRADAELHAREGRAGYPRLRIERWAIDNYISATKCLFTTVYDTSVFTDSEIEELVATYGSLEEALVPIVDKERKECIEKFMTGDIRYGTPIVGVWVPKTEKGSLDYSQMDYTRYSCMTEALETLVYGQCALYHGFVHLPPDTIQTVYLDKPDYRVIFFTIEHSEDYIYSEVLKTYDRSDRDYLKKVIEDGQIIKNIGKGWYGPLYEFKDGVFKPRGRDKRCKNRSSSDCEEGEERSRTDRIRIRIGTLQGVQEGWQ